MRQSSRTAAAALVAATTASAASLADLCTVANVQSALPANGTLLGIELLPSSVTASPVYNASTGGGMSMSTTSSSATYSYCNVTVAYTRPGKESTDNVVVWYGFPSPSDFKNRFYVGGGGGYTISTSATGGLAYGAVTGTTDAGYDGFSKSYDEVVLYGNGSINWDATYMFAYQALGETTLIGKALTKNFYSTSDKIYTYFEGCSDGGREAMSQVQRWGEEYDGVVAGAPAFRYAQQQVNHVFSATVLHTLGYNAPPCELEKIVNLTIAACDPLDGRSDGVVSRTDLCKMNFNLNTTIGEPYYCAAENSTSLGFGFSGGAKVKRQQTTGSTTSYTPAQNGTITAEGVAVAQAIYDGLIGSDGKRGYLSYQTACSLDDASTTYDSSTGEWELSIPSTGGEFVTKYVQLLDLDNLESLDNVTYDTLIDWMNTAMARYLDSLQTTLPDLTPFQKSGGKLLHYHGESDPSIPSGSSVHYFDSVRKTMYADKSYNESVEALGDWYRFFLVPGAAHCGSNSLQPGPYPQSNMDIMIDWVENGVVPERLNATVSSGDNAGETQMLCNWPLRPLWSGNTTDFDCVYDQASIDSWTYTFDAFKMPVY
ncbi:Tannase [Lasiodiplodia hormozganensis]|uniref:Carboxylic ester hydrolase n=1 Tax=Lasiodiplodia hormozganensis TaxID=869390 RepID=A0AA39Z525_9PEZI|nr:Tannase [Lasiodiplodia hormozganensis]